MKEMISITKLGIDKCNVRQDWISDNDLIDSIKAQGIIEDLIVRKSHPNEKVEYTIVAGGRRFNAAVEAGLLEVPCKIKELTDLEAMGISLQENFQRKDLNPIQYSDAIKNIWDKLGNIESREKMIKCNNLFGLKRAQIEAYLNVSKLPKDVKELLLPYKQRSKDLNKKVKGIMPAANIQNKLEVDSASRIVAKLKDKSDKDKFRVAVNLLNKSRLERNKILTEIKGSKESTTKAIKKAREKIDKGYYVIFDVKTAEALKKACMKENKVYTVIIQNSVKEYLKRRRYL